MKTLQYIIIFVFTGLLFACSNEKTAEEPVQTGDESLVELSGPQAKQAKLQLGRVQLKNISTVLKLNGQIDVPPQNLISVSVPLGGYLKSTNMLPGTPIRKGQLLAVMEDPQYIELQEGYLMACTKLDFARKEYERQKQLNAGKAASDKAMQQAESELKQLSISVRALAEKLYLIGINANQLNDDRISRTINIYSPINGYVGKVNLNIGKYVTPSEVIFELVNPADIHLNLLVFEKDLHKIKTGQRVVAYSNTNPEQKYQTEVILVGHSLNSDRSTEVHCHFENYDRKLAPGMYMNAELHLESKDVDALPDEAIVSFENKNYVFVAAGKNSFRLTPVIKGVSAEGFTRIDTDLKGKDIVVRGAYSLLMKLKNTGEEE